MTACVVDASAAGTVEQFPDFSTFYAPELVDLEVANALRKSVLRKQRTPEAASATLEGWVSNEIVRFSHATLIGRIWQLRDNITPYDAAYVALAEQLGVPLITADLRLAAAAAPYCEVITVGQDAT